MTSTHRLRDMHRRYPVTFAYLTVAALTLCAVAAAHPNPMIVGL